MSILCGVDFSEASSSAARVAAALATLGGTPLHLVHAAEGGRGEGEFSSALTALFEQRIARKARSLRERGVRVEATVQTGVPDEVLLDAARRVSARLIVIGARGHRRGDLPLGGHADRVAQTARVPVLVVRDAKPFEVWARGTRPLRILLGVDFSAETIVATRLVAELTQLGPCEVTATYLYWPPAEWARLGLSGIREIGEADPEVTRALDRDFEFCRHALREAKHFELRTKPHLGSVGERLARIADEEKMDLIVVGSKPRATLRRVWEGSVSHTVLELAHTSAACVPSDQDEAPLRATGTENCILVATDFSDIGNEAVRLAFSEPKSGLKVHLVHVTQRNSINMLEPKDIFADSPNADALTARLLALIPEHRARGQVTTEVHVLNSDDKSVAICQAAERLGATSIYMGTHGRTGLSQALLGSVAAGVLAHTERRVVLIRPARPRS